MVMMEQQVRLDLGDADVIPPGHNAWVIGDEPVVAIDFTGLKDTQ